MPHYVVTFPDGRIAHDYDMCRCLRADYPRSPDPTFACIHDYKGVEHMLEKGVKYQITFDEEDAHFKEEWGDSWREPGVLMDKYPGN
jgi:hypothetical protein